MTRHFATILCCLSLALVGCSGDEPDPVDDPDAGAEPDGGGGNVCTGAVYESCADTTTSSDCLDGMMCHFYMQAGFTVCVPACDVNTPCPQQDGADVPCNNMGRCRPVAANACTLP